MFIHICALFLFTFALKLCFFYKGIANDYKISHTNFSLIYQRRSDMPEQKYICKMCGQIVKPLPDGSCPICGAPSEMLEPYADSDEER